MQCFIKQLQVPSLIPSGPLETCVSPGDEQDARTARAEVLRLKTASLPPSKSPCSLAVQPQWKWGIPGLQVQTSPAII